MGNARPEPNLYAEQTVLASIFFENELLDEFRDAITEEHFTEELHRRIWRYMIVLSDDLQDINPVTMAGKMNDDDLLDQMGGTQYFHQLINAVMTIGATRGYIDGLIDYKRRFDLWAFGDAVTYMTNNQEQTFDELLERIEGKFIEAQTGRRENERIWTMSEVLKETTEEALSVYRDGDKGVVGVPTGLEAFDDQTGGFRRGNFICLAGRPGMGKSAVAIQYALGAARAGIGVAFLSLEMKATEMGARVLSNYTLEANGGAGAITYENILKGKFANDEQYRQIVKAEAELGDLPLRIEDAGRKTTSQIRGICKRIKREMKREGIELGLVIVDHIGLISPEKDFRGSKVAEVEAITNELKGMAKILDIPVVGLSQLNRGVESRDDKRPTLSDLRNSGSIEQDADVVVFAYRPVYYLLKNPPAAGAPERIMWEEDVKTYRKIVDLIVAKNRHGAEGSIKLHCNIAFNLIRDRDMGVEEAIDEDIFSQSAMDFQ
jgi:replicative DNA helicase